MFAYDENGHLIGEYQSNGDLIQETIWFNDTPIATIRPNTESHNGLTTGNVKVFFIQPDHLDSPRTIVDNSNQAIWQWHSDPFGKELANADVDGNSVDFVFNLRFPGQYFDVETNTHYNYFRDYEAETGRYLQSDPIGLVGSINVFEYAKNSPIMILDKNGLIAGPKNKVPDGVKVGCNKFTPCKRVKWNMRILLKKLNSHIGWDRKMPAPRGDGRHDTDIDQIKKAYLNCKNQLIRRCKGVCF